MNMCPSQKSNLRTVSRGRAKPVIWALQVQGSSPASDLPPEFSRTPFTAMNNYFRRQVLTIAQQDHLMRRCFPGLRATSNHGGRIVWRGHLQPTAWSEVYEVEIVYEVPRRPHIRILSPQLRVREGCKNCPHTFKDGSLCVHQTHEWNGNRFIAWTIVPWICVWLYFYEVWLRIGVWRGEGTHPDLPEHNAVLRHAQVAT